MLGEDFEPLEVEKQALKNRGDFGPGSNAGNKFDEMK